MKSFTVGQLEEILKGIENKDLPILLSKDDEDNGFRECVIAPSVEKFVESGYGFDIICDEDLDKYDENEIYDAFGI